MTTPNEKPGEEIAAQALAECNNLTREQRDDECPVCGTGYYLPSDACDHCNVHRKDAQLRYATASGQILPQLEKECLGWWVQRRPVRFRHCGVRRMNTDFITQLREENRRLREALDSAESILAWVSRHHDVIPRSEDGTPAWLILDRMLSEICMFKNPPKLK